MGNVGGWTCALLKSLPSSDTPDSYTSLTLGRPSSIAEPSPNIPEPERHSQLYSLVALSRIMSKCASRIYTQKHESLLALWTAANDIRQDLIKFGEENHKDMNFDFVADLKRGEAGVCQAIIFTGKSHRTVRA